MLERAESLAALGRSLAEVRASSVGRLVLVAGEAGVGKTSLLRRFCDGQAEPIRVLWGVCDPLLTPRPLGPLVDVADTVHGEFADLVACAARPYEVAGALLRVLQGRVPTLVVLEDLHWADEATLDVLGMLAVRIGSVPALVLASYRRDELDRSPQLRYIVGELVRRHARLSVEPLSQSGVAELAKPHGADAEELYRRTGGNPFFVTEALAAGGGQIPDTVRDAVLARASRLSVAGQRLLEAVAIVPSEVDVWLLEALAGDLIERLEECIASGMLIPGRAHVAFRHELARLAIEDAIAPNRRVALHRAALTAITARAGNHPDLARLAHHAEAAGDVDAVLRWAPAAAERASASGAHREAAAQYARAIRVSTELASESRALLLARRVDECWMTDQFDAAIEAQHEALRCWRALGDERKEGDGLRTLSRLMFFTGQVSEGESLAREAVERLERLSPGHELALAYANMSQRRMVVEDVAGAIAWGARAQNLARSLDDDEALVYALTNVGAAQYVAGAEEGLIKLQRALALAQSTGLEDHAGRAFASIVRCAVRLRRFAVADAYLEPGLQYCRECGLDTWRLYLLGCRACLDLDRGHWDEAADSAAAVLRDPRSATFPRGMALTALGLVRARRGDPEAAALLLEEHALAQATDEVDRIGRVAAARAEAAWLAGEEASVELLTRAALAMAIERQATCVTELVYWRWQAGLRDELPAGLVAEPYSLSIAGEWNQATELWRNLGCPYEAALALAASDDQDALRESIDELERMGATRAALVIARRLRGRGVRGLPRGPRPSTRENLAGLTTRELEVLALLAQGLRNAQIAERLVVAHKTVDHHVSAILRKLGARTRGEAAALAFEHRLAPQQDPRSREE